MRAPGRVAASFFDSLRILVPNASFKNDFLGPKLGSSRAIHLKAGYQYMYIFFGPKLGPNICIFSFFINVLVPNFLGHFWPLTVCTERVVLLEF